MDTLFLEAQTRPSEKPKSIRISGNIPAVYYGRGKDAKSLILNYQQFVKIYEKAGENTIVELAIDGKKMPVLVHDVQYDPVSDAVSHVDFLHVDMEKEVTTNVKVILIGTAPAVKDLGGLLDVQKHEIRIKCLPKDLIHGIEVDISGIVDFHTTIHVRDLKVPAAIKVLDKPESTVVTAVPPREEEVAKPAEAAPVEGAIAAVPAEGGVAPVAAAAAPAEGAGKKGAK